MSSSLLKSPFTKKKQKKRSKKNRDRVTKVKEGSNNSKVSRPKTKHSGTSIAKNTNDTKSTSTHDQIIPSSNESNTSNDIMKQTSRPRLSKKVSRIYFDAYSKRPKQQEIYENEENKQPKDLPAMKLLEAVHGISSHYTHEKNLQLESQLDTPALLCLGILVEEYTKHCTTDYMEKFNMTSNYFDQYIP